MSKFVRLVSIVCACTYLSLFLTSVALSVDPCGQADDLLTRYDSAQQAWQRMDFSACMADAYDAVRVESWGFVEAFKQRADETAEGEQAHVQFMTALDAFHALRVRYQNACDPALPRFVDGSKNDTGDTQDLEALSASLAKQLENYQTEAERLAQQCADETLRRALAQRVDGLGPKIKQGADAAALVSVAEKYRFYRLAYRMIDLRTRLLAHQASCEMPISL